MSIVSPCRPVIAFGCDHAGFFLQHSLMEKAKSHGFDVIDCGTLNDSSVDYPDFAKRVVDKILHGQAEKGVLSCGTGIGMSITANRYKGIRAACCYDRDQTKIARQHNDINVLCLGSRLTNEETAFECFLTFLQTDFEGGRHQRRLAKIDASQ